MGSCLIMNANEKRMKRYSETGKTKYMTLHLSVSLS